MIGKIQMSFESFDIESSITRLNGTRAGPFREQKSPLFHGQALFQFAANQKFAFGPFGKTSHNILEMKLPFS